MRYLSTLVDRARIAAGMGTTHNGRRDMYETLGYPDTITLPMYNFQYKRGGISARIVEAYPEDTWRAPGVLLETLDPDIDTPFEEAWEALEARLHCWSVFQRADTLAGIGRYSVIVIGAAGKPEDPLPRMTSPDDVLYLMPYSEENATFSDPDLEADTANPRYGKPNWYNVKFSSPSGQKSIQQRVHWTRVLHIADGALESPLFGMPRLERVWNYLIDLDKVAGGGAEAFWLRANRGTVFNIDKDTKVSQTELDAMEEQVDDFEAGLRRMLLTKGVTASDLGSVTADYGPPVASTIGLISGAISIPQRILLGSERGELASTQDSTAWEARIKARRTGFARSEVVGPFVDRLIEMGALPEPGEPWFVLWPDLVERTEEQKVDMADKAAGLNSKAGAIVMTPDEIRDKYLGMDPLEQSQIDNQAGEEPEPEPVPGEQPQGDEGMIEPEEAPE